ncbi:MAG: helix-turn-helix domain-containing protein [Actinobacteria bacterium]|nr:helix-turn-helix domain-containing protein [Actinomycetota bacterium]
MTEIVLSVPESVIEAIADRVATIVVAEIMSTTTTVTPYMTVAEAAEYLRWSKNAIYKLTAARAIPHHKHGGRILFRRDVLDEWLDEYREGPHEHDAANGRQHAARGG